MISMNKKDLSWCVERLPDDIKQIMETHGKKICVAGGFIRACITNDKLNDIDIFTNSKMTSEILSDSLVASGKYRKVTTDNAFTLLKSGRTPIQFIHRWEYESPEDVLKDFDFTLCCSSIWFDEEWNGAVHDNYYQDIAAKRLEYTYPNRIEECGGSMIRVLKYYQKGYRIPLKSLSGVISRLCSGVNEVKDSISEDHLSQIILGLLVEVDPNAIFDEFHI